MQKEVKKSSSNIDTMLEPQVIRREKLFEQLDIEIARLALATGTPLESEIDIQNALQHTDEFQAHNKKPHYLIRQHEQLRGLLVLRYELQVQIIDEMGVDVAHEIMTVAEKRLAELGFKPGSDGVHLDK